VYSNVSAVRINVQSATDRLTDFKNYPTYAFKVIRSNRPEIEMWQIFDMYSEKVLENIV